MCNAPETETWDIVRIMSRGTALLSVCRGQAAKQKEGLTGQSHVPETGYSDQLSFQGLSVSWKREGKGWEGPIVRVQKETSTV